ncbi:unannotated protein [freshwater metagenome]|uniref:Unannotated protein n=1 Tax=freshwater metagenome TaxID=449393 RepID=A0A6J6GT43_9ZZZZ
MVEKLRSVVGLIVTVFSDTATNPPLAVLVCNVNVCTGVAQSTAPVQSLMNLFATSTTDSLNFRVIFRFGVKVVMPFGGSDCELLNVGAIVSAPVEKLHVCGVAESTPA